MQRVRVGIFVGGRGRRMGGRDKSALPAPGGRQTLLERWLQVIAEAGLDDVVLVGGAGAGEDVRPRVQDDPPGVGPLGGLSGLLAHAGERRVLTLACDMPYVEPALLRRLAGERPDAEVLAPRDAQTGKWQSMFARFDAAAASVVVRDLIAKDQRSLQQVFAALNAQELELSPEEAAQLRDWDTPQDMAPQG